MSCALIEVFDRSTAILFQNYLVASFVGLHDDSCAVVFLRKFGITVSHIMRRVRSRSRLLTKGHLHEHTLTRFTSISVPSIIWLATLTYLAWCLSWWIWGNMISQTGALAATKRGSLSQNFGSLDFTQATCTSRVCLPILGSRAV